jgi:hypothetical protein
MVVIPNLIAISCTESLLVAKNHLTYLQDLPRISVLKERMVIIPNLIAIPYTGNPLTAKNPLTYFQVLPSS